MYEVMLNEMKSAYMLQAKAAGSVWDCDLRWA